MTEYYTNGYYIYKIEGNKVYQYSKCIRIWNMWYYGNKQEFFKCYYLTPLTLVDLEMMGVLE